MGTQVTCYFCPHTDLLTFFAYQCFVCIYFNRMPRQRIRTTTRGTTDTEVYRKAAEEHSRDGTKIRALAKKYNVCHVTLYRYINKLKQEILTP